MAAGRELRDSGDRTGALAAFSAADAIMGVPTTSYEVAVTQAELGQLLEARETLRRLLASDGTAQDPLPFIQARSRAFTLDQRLRERVPTLELLVRNAPEGEPLELSIDSTVVPHSGLAAVVPVNPGKRAVTARAGATEVTVEVDAVEGQAIDVPLDFPRPLAAPAAPPPVAAAPAPRLRVLPAAVHGRARRSTAPVVAFVAGGAGVAGLVVGAVTGISALSHKNAAKKECVDGACPPSTWTDLDRARSMALISTVGFAVGAAGIVVGASALLLSEEPKATRSSLRVVPVVGSREASLSLAGRFH